MEADLANTSRKKACAVCGQEYDDEQDVCPFDGTKLTVIGQELLPGTLLGGRYEIVAVVADGGMGKVYKARHKLMNRTVAVKTMLPALVASGTALKRFQQEAEAVSLLNHPNILTIFDFFISDDGQPYLVMDYLEGTNLDEVRKAEGAMAVERALPIFIRACAGIGHAHDRGIVHRDIKPANIMLVDFDGNPDFVKIIDFGIAKLSPAEGGERSRLTATGDVFGSPQFMSPEQCHAKPIDARSDIYSLGCVIYATISGSIPFAGQDAMECMYKHVYEELPRLKDAFPDMNLPVGLEDIVTKATEKDPDQRYQSMSEFRLDLELLRDRLNGGRLESPESPASGEKTVARVMSSLKEAAGTVEEVKTATEIPSAKTEGESPAGTGGQSEVQTVPTIKMRRKQRQNMAVLAGAVALVLIVVAGIALWFQHQGQSGAGVTSKVQQASITAPSAGQPPEVIDNKQPVSSSSAAPIATTSGGNSTPPTAEATFAKYFKQGQDEFKAGRYSEAQKSFQSAHNTASDFGQRDPRYIDSIEWQGKTAYELGSYGRAKQALEWVVYARKSTHSPKLKQSQKELSMVIKAMK